MKRVVMIVVSLLLFPLILVGLVWYGVVSPQSRNGVRFFEWVDRVSQDEFLSEYDKELRLERADEKEEG